VGVCVHGVRRIDAPGIERLTGSGCTTGRRMAEAQSCKDELVYVVGGANSAGQAAMYFSRVAKKVTILVRGDGLEKSMSKYLIDQIAGTSNITVETRSEVVEAMGETHLESVKNPEPQGGRSAAGVVGIPVHRGAPQNRLLPEKVMREPQRFVLSGAGPADRRATAAKHGKGSGAVSAGDVDARVFVAGDVRHGSVKRAATAVGEGSMAVQLMHQYLAQF